MNNKGSKKIPWNKGKRNRVSVECAECGTSLERFPSQIKNSKTGNFFCNIQCKSSHRKGKKRSPEVCEKISKSHIGVKLSQKHRESISKAHQTKSYKKKMAGENHPLYGKRRSMNFRIGHSCKMRGINIDEFDGFATERNLRERIRFRNTIQKRVFERDDYTCQMCGERGGKLHVDHIQPWAEYVELRFSMNNLRTLCMGCHYQITFGREMPEDVSTWGHNFNQRIEELKA